MKIRLVGADFFHSDEQTEEHGEAFAVLKKRLKTRKKNISLDSCPPKGN